MEILIWLWIWDKRFFFGMRHHPTLVLNVWMLPIMFSLLMGLHSYEEVFELRAIEEQVQGDINACSDSNLTSKALHYQFVQTKKGHHGSHSSHQNSESQKGNSSSHQSSHFNYAQFTHFDYWQRQNTIFSLFGLALLLLNLYIYSLSFSLNSAFYSTHCPQDLGYLTLPSQSPSSFLTFWHAYSVKICGTIALGTFGLAILLKAVNVISFLTCPLKMLAFKQKVRNF